MHVRETDSHLYVLGLLTTEETATLEGHIAECGTCRETLADVAKRVFRPEPPTEGLRLRRGKTGTSDSKS